MAFMYALIYFIVEYSSVSWLPCLLKDFISASSYAANMLIESLSKQSVVLRWIVNVLYSLANLIYNHQKAMGRNFHLQTFFFFYCISIHYFN